MLKIDPSNGRLVPLGRRALEPAPLFEKFSIERLLRAGPDEFFAEAGRPLVVIAWDLETVPNGRKIPLLAADQTGRIYVVEVQRAAERPVDLARALEDATVVASWGAQGLLERLGREAAERIGAGVAAPLERLNHEQGVVLAAETFSDDTLASAGWLRQRYGVALCCIRVRLETERSSGASYLSCDDLTIEMERALDERKAAAAGAGRWIDPGLEGSVKAEPAGEERVIEEREELPQPPNPPAPTLYPPYPADSPFDAALAEIVGAQDREGREPEEQLAPAEGRSLERRGAPRIEDCLARRLRLEYFGRILGARLLNLSADGIGVEAVASLPIGAEVGLSAEVICEDGTKLIEGCARVEHCRVDEDGVCRMGFSLKGARLRAIDSEEAFGRR